MKRVLLPLAEGFEEIEAIAVIDILRRAGIEVVIAGFPGSIVKSARGVQVISDRKLSDVKAENFDAIVLHGGNPGCKNLASSQRVIGLLKEFDAKGKLICAICAAPSILAQAGVLRDRKATIYPGREREISKPRSTKVVADENIITGQSPAAAIEFALRIVSELAGESVASELKKDLVF